jgi:hypothetical protein
MVAENCCVAPARTAAEEGLIWMPELPLMAQLDRNSAVNKETKQQMEVRRCRITELLTFGELIAGGRVVQGGDCQQIASVQSKVQVWDNYQDETGLVGRVRVDKLNRSKKRLGKEQA